MVGQVTFPVPPEPEPEPPPELEVPPPVPVVGGGVEVVEVVGLEAVPPHPERKKRTDVASGNESRRRRNKEHLGKWMCKKMRIACPGVARNKRFNALFIARAGRTRREGHSADPFWREYVFALCSL